jgi:hypothetical protein
MLKCQAVLSIGDESKAINEAIIDFIKRLGLVAFQMMISDPPLVFDIKQIGQKVQYTQYKCDSLDGFIKNN